MLNYEQQLFREKLNFLENKQYERYVSYIENNTRDSIDAMYWKYKKLEMLCVLALCSDMGFSVFADFSLINEMLDSRKTKQCYMENAICLEEFFLHVFSDIGWNTQTICFGEEDIEKKMFFQEEMFPEYIHLVIEQYINGIEELLEYDVENITVISCIMPDSMQSCLRQKGSKEKEEFNALFCQTIRPLNSFLQHSIIYVTDSERNIVGFVCILFDASWHWEGSISGYTLDLMCPVWGAYLNQLLTV